MMLLLVRLYGVQQELFVVIPVSASASAAASASPSGCFWLKFFSSPEPKAPGELIV